MRRLPYNSKAVHRDEHVGHTCAPETASDHVTVLSDVFRGSIRSLLGVAHGPYNVGSWTVLDSLYENL
jgi:hypothetical protein